ncbi:MAG TPA: glycosyltransferase family 2 protein, partial [Candidatus Dormibacteraeota bacterium]|nr:glycosyltransferase family 2 protein [Candidatus Dormibacteraeota bacterium]
MTVATGLALAMPGAILAGFSIYLLALAIASFGSRAPRPGTATASPTLQLAVVVPAHDEEQLVARCVRSLINQTYPRALYRVVVVADNCADGTASAAAAAGAEVMVRDESQARGKGRALRWAVDRLFAKSESIGAVVVVDADSVADQDLLTALVARAEAGHQVVQADYTVLIEDSSSARARLVAAGFLLFHRVRFAGRSRLGMSANLVGNGMLFTRRVLREHPWDAFTGVEDLEHSIHLRLAGVGIEFACKALVAGPPPATRGGELRQRMRWEGGRFHVVRTRLPELVRTAVVRRDFQLLDAALDLATPPLGLLTIATAAGVVTSAAAAVLGLAPWWAVAPWFVAALAV